MACVGIVTGLLAEASCLPRPGAMPPPGARPLVFCSGADAARAEAGALRLLDGGATALVSFGIAAGLAPTIRPGDVVVADAVVTPDGRTIPTHAGWRRRLLDYLGTAGNGDHAPRVAGTDVILGSGRDKRRLFEATGAAVADMESHAVALVARQAGVPFLAVRAVADAAERFLPPVAFSAVRSDGSTAYLAVAGHLLLRPWQLPALIGLMRDSRLALAVLRRAAAPDSPLLVAPSERL